MIHFKNTYSENFLTEHFKKGYNTFPHIINLASGDITGFSALRKLKNTGVQNSFILESLGSIDITSRYTIIGFNPEILYNFQNNNICKIFYKDNKIVERVFENPVEFLKQEFIEIKTIETPFEIPITGGLFGYFGFDATKSILDLDIEDWKYSEYPIGIFGLYKNLIIFDNFKRGNIFVVNNIYAKNLQDYRENRRLAEIESNKYIEVLFHGLDSQPIHIRENSEIENLQIDSNLDKESYRQILSFLKEKLNNGDIFQTIVSQKFRFDLKLLSKKINALDIFRILRVVNPSSYMFCFDFGDFEIIGSVPETYIKIDGKTILQKPLAGTRGRGDTLSQDNKYEKELLHDKKERAEHAMLIDLVRNDLTRSCELGSVKVAKKMYIKKYNHTMHIVSDIIGKISHDKTHFDAFCGSFPHGNVTGAPKIRAIEYINQLEPEARGIYSGALGYFGFNGNSDFAVIIRSFILKDNILEHQVGSGIVADFSIEGETKEIINKNKTFKELVKLLFLNYK